jgi:hypothetical protein
MPQEGNMPEPSTIVTGLAAIGKLAADIAAANDTTKRNALLIEFQKALIEAQSTTFSEQLKNASLANRNQELEAECARLREQVAALGQFDLVEISHGLFARVGSGSTEPLKSAHKYCATCFDNGRKSVLQLQLGEMRKRGLYCANCKTTLWLFRNAFSDEHAA